MTEGSHRKERQHSRGSMEEEMKESEGSIEGERRRNERQRDMDKKDEEKKRLKIEDLRLEDEKRMIKKQEEKQERDKQRLANEGISRRKKEELLRKQIKLNMEKQKLDAANAKKEIERKRVADVEARRRKLQIESFKKTDKYKFSKQQQDGKRPRTPDREGTFSWKNWEKAVKQWKVDVNKFADIEKRKAAAKFAEVLIDKCNREDVRVKKMEKERDLLGCVEDKSLIMECGQIRGINGIKKSLEEDKLEDRQVEENGLESAEPTPVLAAPVLLQQEVELDSEQELVWMLGHLASPGEVWVQPMQRQTARLQELEDCLSSAQPGPLAGTGGLLEGSCWALENCNSLLQPSLCSCPWLRVRVETCTPGEFLAVRSLDYGVLARVPAASLRHLPPGLPRELPGLAVRCHLAGLAPHPGGEWSEGATATARALLHCDRVYSARVVERQGASLGILEEQGEGESMGTVGQRLVELGLARKVQEPKSIGEDEYGWDPMAQDHATIANNYLTNDNDLAVATHGYRTRAAVCQFFLNKGWCWKASYCPQLHSLPREGAVTTDQEEILVSPREDFLLRPHTQPKRVLLKHLISPSAFYLTFPNGTRDVSLLNTSDLQRSSSPRHSTFQGSLNQFYSESPKRFLLSSLPAPSSLLVVREGRAWYRATVLSREEGEEEGDAKQTVFLVDEGRRATVHLNDIR